MTSPSLTVVLVLGWASAAVGQPAPRATPAERYLRAMALADQGRLGPASEELELLASTPWALKDRSAFEAGGLFERREGLKRAAALYAAVSQDSVFFAEARLAQARVERLQGNLGAAGSAVVPLTKSPVRQVRRRALQELASLAELQHDERARHDVATRLAAERAPWLGGAPVLAALAGFDEPLLRRGACREAERAARGTPPALRCAARLFAAEASACVGTEVGQELRRIVADCQEPELTSRAWMTLGLLAARSGQADTAAASFREAAKLTPAAPLAADALFAAFWVQWRANPADAPSGDLTLAEALPQDLSSQDRARLRYWQSRAAQARGAHEEALALLAEVALVYPASYYGLLARERLTALDGARASTVELAQVIPAPSDDADEPAVLTRLAPGLEALALGREDAAAELVALALRGPSPLANRATLEALHAAGAGPQAYRFAREVFRQQPGDRQDAALWETAFPTPFSELLAVHGDEAGVAPGLLQGLVREESGFAPQARSHCGALGLMQLMPTTARALAAEQGLALQSLNELLEPQRNVQLGSRYLGQLLRRFDHNRTAATAAYNGGPTRVAQWLKQARAGQQEEWVEELPLDETRNYVKDVLASADVYRHFFAQRALTFASVGQRAPVALP